ncbi:CIC11C00000002380 [Sungouiella intermedia]|uniref:CIC11C00000002380 n=2 Tax=Sungouiella intermedia TaxID=45354 RepID=A0A1L0G2L8_9ASCO|nr:CIC11C00000002380 [[Candida] intermedia]
MDMSDAFNNYCITCDQLCLPYAVYCSNQCKEKDEHQLATLLQSCNHDIVSPLLTPSLYQPQQISHELGDSPLLLPSSMSNTDVQEFSLNYLVSQAPSRVPATSTLQNYRLWLTGVM